MTTDLLPLPPGRRSGVLLPIGVRIDAARRHVADHLRRTWAQRADEDGLDEAVTKMVWLAVGISVAVAATAFFITVFDTAQSGVPDPVAPTP